MKINFCDRRQCVLYICQKSGILEIQPGNNPKKEKRKEKKGRPRTLPQSWYPTFSWTPIIPVFVLLLFLPHVSLIHSLSVKPQ